MLYAIGGQWYKIRNLLNLLSCLSSVRSQICDAMPDLPPYLGEFWRFAWHFVACRLIFVEITGRQNHASLCKVRSLSLRVSILSHISYAKPWRQGITCSSLRQPRIASLQCILTLQRHLSANYGFGPGRGWFIPPIFAILNGYNRQGDRIINFLQ